MKKDSTSFRKNIKTVSQGTTSAALLLIIIMLTGTMTTTTSVAAWATTTGAIPTIENSTDIDQPTQGTEGLAEEAQQVGTAVEEPSSSSNQSEPSTTTAEEENASSSIEGPVLEEPIVPPLNQTGTVEPLENLTTTAVTNATNATATNATTRLDGQIVFEKAPTGDDPYNTEIYIMNADNSSGQTRLTRLTDEPDASASSPSLSRDGIKIAFEGNGEIYVMNSDGSGVTRLTDNNASDTDPDWSPDGEKIAFVSGRAFQDPEGLNRNYEIYVMNSDGSGVTRLTDNDVWDSDPNWSPDGTKIAFESSGITVMNADGSGQTNINPDGHDPDWSPDGEKIAFTGARREGGVTFVMNADDGSDVTRMTEGWDPTWSPDGTKIAFIGNRFDDESDNNAIYVMNSADGSNVTELTDSRTRAYYENLDWGTTTSPPSDGGDDGSGSPPTTNTTRPNGQIAFVRGNFEDPPLDEIYVMNSDGSGQTRLTTNDVIDRHPSWSPDGEKIAFDSYRDDPAFDTDEIYVMKGDGSEPTRLTNNNASDFRPTWSPDGEKIAFVSDRDGNYGIYVMNAADGSGVTRLTADGFDPTWSPDGTKIAFTSNRDATGGANNGIYVMNAADGSGVTRLTDSDAYYSDPTWSPDSEKIAFTSNRDSGGIFVMNADDGSGVTRLTEGGSPTWSPDGTKIAFVSDRDASEDGDVNAIYVMNSADGSNVTRLTDPDAYYDNLDWGGITTSPPEQAIDKVISTIQNLDIIPQSVKTNLIGLLRQALDSLNDDTTTNSTITTTYNVP
jgi:Tol biopolymer transport system component